MQTVSSSPVAYVSLGDPNIRAAITNALDTAGWTVVAEPTGFHLIHALSDVIEGTRSPPKLIVIDAWSRGCAGTTIAAGLRDLGITIPIVLVGRAAPVSSDRMLRIVDAGSAEAVVREIAAAPAVAELRWAG